MGFSPVVRVTGDTLYTWSRLDPIPTFRNDDRGNEGEGLEVSGVDNNDNDGESYIDTGKEAGDSFDMACLSCSCFWRPGVKLQNPFSCVSSAFLCTDTVITRTA